MQKTITIDEKKIFTEILAGLDGQYDLVYVDYNDELPADIFEKCLENGSDEFLYDNDVYGEARCYHACNILDGLLKDNGLSDDEIRLFKTCPEYDDLRMEIESRDASNPEGELCEKSLIHGYLIFGSNYDCWIPLWETGGLQCEGTALDGVLAALSLNPKKVKQAAMKAGIATSGRWRNMPGREGKEAVDYDQFVNVLRETPNYGNWTFFGRFDGKAMLENNFNTNGMVIPKETACAMFNPWNGGGSLDFCSTVRDLPLAELRRRQDRHSDCYYVRVDERECRNHGYTPQSVYGSVISDKIFLE